MTLFSLVVEILFDALCGWVGYAVVKVITFGKVELDWKNGSDSVVASVFGLLFLLMLLFLVAWLIEHSG